MAKNCGMRRVTASLSLRVTRTHSCSEISARYFVRSKRERNSLSVAHASGLRASWIDSALAQALANVLTTVPGSGSRTSR